MELTTALVVPAWPGRKPKVAPWMATQSAAAQTPLTAAAANCTSRLGTTTSKVIAPGSATPQASNQRGRCTRR